MLLCIYGKTGSGKDHTANIFKRKYGFEQLVRPTTRPKRAREVEGETYEFFTEHSYLELLEKGKVSLTYQFRGWHYGVYKTIIDMIESDTQYVITGDKEMARDIAYLVRDNCENSIWNKLFFLEVIAPKTVRVERLFGRITSESSESDSEKEFLRRMSSDDEDYAKIFFDPDFEIGSFGGEKDYLETIDEIIYDIEKITKREGVK